MKKMFVTIILASTASVSRAQFHTLMPYRTCSKVETAGSVQKQKDLSGCGKVDSVASWRKARIQGEADRQIWIRKYLSVSYPLDEITVNSRFGARRDPFTGKTRRHNGIDLRARYVEVYSMFEGRVVKVGSDKRSGKYVVIRYGDYLVSYCHLSRPMVRKGAKVMPGEVVAISGNSGRSTGPHLHITCSRLGEPVNPEILLQLVKRTRQEAVESLG